MRNKKVKALRRIVKQSYGEDLPNAIMPRYKNHSVPSTRIGGKRKLPAPGVDMGRVVVRLEDCVKLRVKRYKQAVKRFGV